MLKVNQSNQNDLLIQTDIRRNLTPEVVRKVLRDLDPKVILGLLGVLDPKPTNEIMNRREAAPFVRFSEKGFRNAVRDGVFPEIKIGKKRLYRRSALIKALTKREEFAV